MEQREVRVAGEIIGLTSLEYELLDLLLRYPGRAFSHAQLLELIPAFQPWCQMPRDPSIE